MSSRARREGKGGKFYKVEIWQWFKVKYKTLVHFINSEEMERENLSI